MSLLELRHYELFPHNREHLHARFAEHTAPIFERLGLRARGFYEITCGPGEGDLVYFMEWESPAERAEGWARFAADPEWQKVRAETNGRHGPLVARTHSQLLVPTSYSRDR
ncbi:NIPSNAP protein [Pseudonocardia thermophila]|uniref:NIPSNAP protein n=1 Tax=Pseudonocardia thermophila TaxID=1848 RepID=A0A1M6P537_PSETH|nr:NIPSNAP family protein [Pseudonocardia thermophila]SHK03006.1 NIPSNAP protein [Pseudonocardia thermophila]